MVRYDNPPAALILNDRLVNEINFMHEYTKREKQEVAGFLIRGLHGGVGIVSPVLGKGLEVDLEPNEDLHHGESYLGVFHTHPLTETFSPHDIATFLADPTERVSVCYGADGVINLTIKANETEGIGKEDISTLKEAYDQEEIPDLAEQHKFLYYRGKGNRLTIVTSAKTSDEQTLDDFVHGIMGEPNIPQTHVKKVKASVKRSVVGLLDSRRFYALYSAEGEESESEEADKWITLSDGRHIIIGHADWVKDNAVNRTYSEVKKVYPLSNDPRVMLN